MRDSELYKIKWILFIYIFFSYNLGVFFATVFSFWIHVCFLLCWLFYWSKIHFFERWPQRYDTFHHMVAVQSLHCCHFFWVCCYFSPTLTNTSRQARKVYTALSISRDCYLLEWVPRCSRWTASAWGLLNEFTQAVGFGSLCRHKAINPFSWDGSSDVGVGGWVGGEGGWAEGELKYALIGEWREHMRTLPGYLSTKVVLNEDKLLLCPRR